MCITDVKAFGLANTGIREEEAGKNCPLAGQKGGLGNNTSYIPFFQTLSWYPVLPPLLTSSYDCPTTTKLSSRFFPGTRLQRTLAESQSLPQSAQKSTLRLETCLQLPQSCRSAKVLI
jgi:hypothetical protein